MADATAPDMETECDPPVPGAIAFLDRWLCPKCSQDRLCCELERVRCDDCCGDGMTAPGHLYEMDPCWFDEEDTEPCNTCQGKGGWWVCSGGCEDGRHQEQSAAAADPTGKPLFKAEVDEGWGWPGNAGKAHYFSGSRSLCNKWLFLGSLYEDARSHLTEGDLCKACLKRSKGRGTEDRS